MHVYCVLTTQHRVVIHFCKKHITQNKCNLLNNCRMKIKVTTKKLCASDIRKVLNTRHTQSSAHSTHAKFCTPDTRKVLPTRHRQSSAHPTRTKFCLLDTRKVLPTRHTQSSAHPHPNTERT